MHLDNNIFKILNFIFKMLLTGIHAGDNILLSKEGVL